MSDETREPVATMGTTWIYEREPSQRHNASGECIQVKTSYPQEWATYEHLHAIACNLDVSAYAAHALEALGFAKWEQHQYSEVLRLTKAGEVLHRALQAVEKAKACVEEKPVYVARWKRSENSDGWVLMAAGDLGMSVAWMRDDVGRRKDMATEAEQSVRRLGFIPAGPIDRTALERP